MAIDHELILYASYGFNPLFNLTHLLLTFYYFGYENMMKEVREAFL